MQGMLGHIVHYVIIALLLGFTVTRQIEVFNFFIAPDQWLVKIFALSLTEGGGLGWAIYHKWLWTSAEQFTISFLMLWVSIGSVVLGTLLDMYITMGHNGVLVDNPAVVQVMLYAIMAIVVCNCAAYAGLYLNEPEHQKHFRGDGASRGIGAQQPPSKAVGPFTGGTQVQDVTPARPQQKPAGPYQQPTQHPVPSLPSPKGGMDDLPTRVMPKDFPQAQSSKNNGLSQQQVKNQQNGHEQTSFREFPKTRVLDQGE